MGYGIHSLLREEAVRVGRLRYYVQALLGHVTGESPLGVLLPAVVEGAQQVIRDVDENCLVDL